MLGKFTKIQGLAVDDQSRVYIVDSFQCAVQVFDSATGGPIDGVRVTLIDVTANILAGGKNSRLYKRLVYDMQIAQDVFAGQASSQLASVRAGPHDVEGEVLEDAGPHPLPRGDPAVLAVAGVVDRVGRTGKWFAVEHWDVVPDIMTMAKGLTSAYAPLGAVAMKPEIAAAFNETPFESGLTYTSHPISLAAAVANINAMMNHSSPSEAGLAASCVPSDLQCQAK